MVKIVVLLLMCGVALTGCFSPGFHHKACEVLTPASVNLPTTQNDQRVEAIATGESGNDRNQEQNCP